MLTLSVPGRVFLYALPTDMRKSFDGLCGIVEEVFGNDVLSGHLFLFFNRRRDRVKILRWEGDGLVIWYKRLESGTFQLPSQNMDCVELDATDLSLILGGVDLQSARRRKRYRRVS